MANKKTLRKIPKSKEIEDFNDKYSLIIPENAFKFSTEDEFSVEIRGKAQRNWLKQSKLLLSKPIYIYSILILFVTLILSISFSLSSPFKSDALPNANSDHFIGVTTSGYDAWLAIWEGTRKTLLTGIIVGMASTVIGLIIGSWTGYHLDSAVDKFFVWVVKVFDYVPKILWYVFILIIFSPGFWGIVLSFLLTTWTKGVLSIRNHILANINSEFIRSTEVVGSGRFASYIKHMLPNFSSVVFSIMISSISQIIIYEVSISIIGLLTTTKIGTLGEAMTSGLLQYKAGTGTYLQLLIPTLILSNLSFSLYTLARGVQSNFTSRKEVI